MGTLQRLALLFLAAAITLALHMRSLPASPFAHAVFALGFMSALVLIPYWLTGIRMLPDLFYDIAEAKQEPIAWDDRSPLSRFGIVVRDAAFVMGALAFGVAMVAAGMKGADRILACDVAAWSALVVMGVVTAKRVGNYLDGQSHTAGTNGEGR